MKITGSHRVRADRRQVWEALHDPEVLVRTLPGCERLEQTGDGEYQATVRAGVASIKGTYAGRVSLSELDEPSAYTLKASGQGGPGTIDATARVTLSDDEGGTRIDYHADAIVGGAIAGVGQRVLTGVSKRNAAQFFDAVDEVLAGQAAPEQWVAPAEQVWQPPPAPAGANGTDLRRLLAAGITGAAIALLGVLVGRRTAR